jgi:hypothetical protein
VLEGGAWRDWDLDRRVIVDHLVLLAASRRLDPAEFADLVDGVYSADSHEELATSVVASPSPVHMTPPDLCLDEPLEIEVGHGQVKLERRWQLGADTTVTVGHGQAILDLTKAEWDSPVVQLELLVRFGQAIVTVPDGVRVTFGRLAANVVNKLRDTTLLPGAPELHINAEVAHGQIILRSPKRSRLLVRRLRRRARRSRGSR